MAAAARALLVLVTCAGAWRSGGAGAGPSGGAVRARCPPDAPQRCVLRGYGHNEYSYTVDGTHVEIEYKDSGYFSLKCAGNVTLDNSALPRFDTQLHVNTSVLSDCSSPRLSYAAALERLNVYVHGKLKLVRAGNITRALLAGLERLPALELDRVQLAPGALLALPELRGLLLDRVTLPPDELLRLPLRLQKLQLVRLHTDVPAAALQRLPELRNLTVRDAQRVSVQLAGALQSLAFETPAAPRTLLPSLLYLDLVGWDERRPEPWLQCDALLELQAHYAAAERLPAHWLRACGALRVLRVLRAPGLRELQEGALAGAAQLRELHVERCALRTLPARLLADAARLQLLRITRCELQALPADLLQAATQLSLLDLSGNSLLALPGGLFSMTGSLHTLNLSKNNLTTDVFSSLEAVRSLTSLVLSDNINLKDSCGKLSDPVRDTSPLQSLNMLTNLELRNTSTTIICRDWRDQMPRLTSLDLADNNITVLTYADLQFGSAAAVQLRGNNVSRLLYTRRDYDEAVRPGAGARASVLLPGALGCDCNEYWAARALRDRPEHAALRNASCGRAGPLAAVPLDELLCDAPGLCAGAPPACRCAVQRRAAAPAHLVRVRCERAGVASVAHVLAPVRAAARALGLPAPDTAWDVRLAHNRVVPRAADLPANLTALDLRDNGISVMSAELARALLAGGRRVWLAGNPLPCGCGAAPALGQLRALRDRAAAVCADGSPLERAAPAPCAGAGPALAAGAGALLLLAGAALAALLARPALRLRLKAALHARGWLPDAEPADGRRFDAFVSFAHADERWVRALVARLEAGAAPYRLCVHYRDWAPGGWIPAQIAASVRASRRTVAVLSEHFLRSAWARAELREAYALALRDERPRLVLLLLAAPERLPLDAGLRAYMAANTYVRWDDPWFWHKLRLALPRSRGRAPAPAPAPAAAAWPADIPSPPQTILTASPTDLYLPLKDPAYNPIVPFCLPTAPTPAPIALSSPRTSPTSAPITPSTPPISLSSAPTVPSPPADATLQLLAPHSADADDLTPQASDVTPHVGDITPHVSDITPHVNDVTAHVGDVTPDGSDITPHVNDVTAHVGDVTPDVSDITPHVGDITPHANDVTPLPSPV